MQTRRWALSRPIFLFFLCLVALAGTACRVATHPFTPSALGVSRATSEMLRHIDEPGTVPVDTIVAADWEVPRSGLLNLDHPRARAAGLVDGPEAIQVFMHAIRHPSFGTFLVDTGIERALRDDPEHAAIRGLVADVANIKAMKIHIDTKSWLAAEPRPLAGVFITHLHLDHIAGLRDIPRGTPIYTGPGETAARSLENIFVQGVTDAELEGQNPLNEWRFQPDGDGRFQGVMDVFGDGMVWAILVPGHTLGSTAFLVRTPKGPVLLTGDACHTTWGWEHGVEPGSFSYDKAESADHLARLRRLVAEHPLIEVRLGHQAFKPVALSAPRAAPAPSSPL